MQVTQTVLKTTGKKSTNTQQKTFKTDHSHPILQLHAKIGNAATLSLLSSMSQTRQRPHTETSDNTSQSAVNFETSFTDDGSPIEMPVRKFMESKFNHGFSDVRIHNESNAQKMTSEVGADAFTTGNDIYFGQNRYEPSSEIGLGLLAHELAHVVQQGGEKRHAQSRGPIIESGNSFEMEANSAALSVLENKPVTVTNRVSQAPIQRGLWDWFKSKAKAVGGAIVSGAEAVGGAIAKGAEWVAENIPFVGDLKRVLKKAGDVIGTILNDPVGFLGNLLEALKGGLYQFSANIWKHLSAGFTKWLFGTLADAGITMPERFDLQSIFGLILQILGLTTDRIKQKVATLVGAKNFEILERIWQHVTTLITEGPKGLWNLIVEDASAIIDSMFDAVKSWAIETIIKQGVIKLASMFSPVGAIVQAVKMIYDVVTFVIEKAQQITALIDTIMGSLGAIAAGNTKSASDWIEKTLANMIPLAIGFLANLLGLGGISKTIKDTITKIQGKVDIVVDKALKKLLDPIIKATQLVGKAIASKVKNALFPSHAFDVDGESHTIYAEETPGGVETMIKSTPQSLAQLLESKKDVTDPEKKTAVSRAKKILSILNQKQKDTVASKNKKSSKETTKGESEVDAKTTNEIIKLQLELAEHLQIIMHGEKTDDINKYAFEGMFGTYENTVTQKGDALTPDHQPQASLIQNIAEKFPTKKLKQVASGHANGGFTVNLAFKRHVKTRTYGKKVSSEAISNINDALNSKNNETKKGKLLQVLIKERNDDVDKINENILDKDTKEVWGDIHAISKADEKEKNVERIKNQIRKGEENIKKTDSAMKDWFEE